MWTRLPGGRRPLPHAGLFAGAALARVRGDPPGRGGGGLPALHLLRRLRQPAGSGGGRARWRALGLSRTARYLVADPRPYGQHRPRRGPTSAPPRAPPGASRRRIMPRPSVRAINTSSSKASTSRCRSAASCHAERTSCPRPMCRRQARRRSGADSRHVRRIRRRPGASTSARCARAPRPLGPGSLGWAEGGRSTYRWQRSRPRDGDFGPHHPRRRPPPARPPARAAGTQRWRAGPEERRSRGIGSETRAAASSSWASGRQRVLGAGRGRRWPGRPGATAPEVGSRP